LRYMDHSTGHQGPCECDLPCVKLNADLTDTEEFIDRIDKERDEAAHSVRGRGVHLLARLDVSPALVVTTSADV
jgi:hypothetical protein